MRGAHTRIGPVQPGQQRRNIVRIDCWPTPDPEASWRITIGTDIQRRTLGIQQTGQILLDLGLAGGVETLEPGIDDREADRGRRAGGGIGGEAA